MDERITGKSAQLGGTPAKNFDPNILRELAAAPTFPVYGSSRRRSPALVERKSFMEAAGADISPLGRRIRRGPVLTKLQRISAARKNRAASAWNQAL